MLLNKKRMKLLDDKLLFGASEYEDKLREVGNYSEKDYAICKNIVNEFNRLGYKLTHFWQCAFVVDDEIIPIYKKYIAEYNKLISEDEEDRYCFDSRHRLITINLAQPEYKMATTWCLEEFLKAPATKVTGDFTVMGIKFDWAEAIEKQQNPEFLKEYLKILKDKKHIIDSSPIERLYKKLTGSLPNGLEEKRKKWEEEAKRKGAKNPIPEEYQAIAQRAREKYPNRGKNSKKEK